jgi:hypothetical protein
MMPERRHKILEGNHGHCIVKYSDLGLSSIVTVVKSSGLLKRKRKVYKDLVGKPFGKWPVGRQRRK